MASVQDLKRRIRSVRNTRKITRAMELVAASKLRRAQTRIESMRPYANAMRELIAGVGRAAGSVRSLPLLQQREQIDTVLVVPLTGVYVSNAKPGPVFGITVVPMLPAVSTVPL